MIFCIVLLLSGLSFRFCIVFVTESCVFEPSDLLIDWVCPSFWLYPNIDCVVGAVPPAVLKSRFSCRFFESCQTVALSEFVRC